VRNRLRSGIDRSNFPTFPDKIHARTILVLQRTEIDRPCLAIQRPPGPGLATGVGANRGEELYRPEASDRARSKQFNLSQIFFTLLFWSFRPPR